VETINLIPQEERVQQVKTKVVKASTILAILVLVIVAGVGGFFYYKTYTVRAQVEELEGKITNLRSDINDLSKIEIDARNLFKKSTILGAIFDSRAYYSVMLEELETSVPSGVIIKSYGLNKEKAVAIAGLAQTYNQVQEFSNKLLERPLFTEVTLNSVGLENNKERINFFILVAYNEELLNE